MNDNNKSFSVLDTYIEVENIHNTINEKIFKFKNECMELETLSNHEFKMQKTLKLNKIYFQGYISSSNACSYLKEGKFTKCTYDQLRSYLNNYQQQNNLEDLSPYFKALNLYELADDIEKSVDNKVRLEMRKIYELDKTIDKIVKANQEVYEELYNTVKNNIINNYVNKNLLDEKNYNICIVMLNDIFNFYISGYPDIINEI